MLKGKYSKPIIILLLVVTLFIPATVHGVSEEQPSSEINQPQVEILNETAEAIDLVVRFPANPIFDHPEGNTFNKDIYTHPSEVGVPDLPVLRKSIELPFANDYNLEIIDVKSYAAQLGENGLPASITVRAPEVEKSEPQQSAETAEDAASDPEGPFPAAPAQLVQTFVVRGHKVGQLQLWPVVLTPDGQSIEVFEEITFRIHIDQSDLNMTASRSSSFASSAFDKLLSPQILNYSEGTNIQSDRSKGNEPILVIAPDAFISTLNTLVDLKENQGHPVTLVALSTTGSTANSIKSYISNAYHNWPSPPTYVILVGDVDNGANTMPAFTGLSSETVTDLYYGTVDGDDWIPDVFVGRMPARSTSQLNTMINNLIAYNNLTGTEGWIKKAAFLASNDSNYWEVAESTQNYVISTHTQPDGYTGAFPSSPQAGGDKLYAHTYSAGNGQVVDAINNRRALISYTGHGSRTSWGGPSYSQSNIRNINHTGAFSVVTSFACITGDFNTTESFGETWLIQPNKGAVAFIGSSSSTFWGPDDTFERAMMDSLYSGSDYANVVGSFRFDGLMAIETSRPGTGTAQSRYYWESYNILGDPSLEMMVEPKDSDFTLSANPSAISVCQGSSQDTTVNVGQVNSFTDPVSLSLDSLPTGVSGGYAQNPVTPPAASTLTLSAENNTPLGQYPVRILGNSGDKNHEFELSLQVFDSSPENVALSEPANGSSNVSVSPTFTWQETQTNQTYEIEVSKTSNFSNPIISQSGLQAPSFTPASPLEHNTLYYWRVRASNPCGSSEFTEIYQITTLPAPGSCPEGMAPAPFYQTQFESNPENWTHSGTNDSWTRTTTRSHSPSYAYFSKDQTATSLQHLTTPVIDLPDTSGAPITLAFWHWFEIEASSNGCFDGALLQISTDGGDAWTPIEDSLILTSNYTGTISSSYGNPMGGQQAWCGSRDWSEALIDLTAYAGQSVQLRFTHTSDASIGLEGWYVDDFSVSACEVIPDYRPRFNTPSVSASQAPGQEVTVNLELTNAGLQPDSYSLNLTSNTWAARVKNQDTISLSPGEVKVLEVSVTIPADAQPGQTEEVLVSVTSQNDPGLPAAEDTATIELKTNPMNVYIPLISNP
jgi:hypothetical protein